MAASAVQAPSLAAVITAALAHPHTLPSLSPEQWRVLHALRMCRTPALGGHEYQCPRCGYEHFVPHSCGNRHCPLCQGGAAERWLQGQQALLLPVPYFHLVFTLPHGLNPLIRQNRRALYTLLFDAASQTLLTFGRNRFGGLIGLTAVLHTWGQTLIDHYHLHCVVTGGGWDRDRERWVGASGRYLFPVKALALVFQGKYLAGLQRLYARGKLEFHGQLAPLRDVATFQELVRTVSGKRWVVYAKRPFAGPDQVLRYVGRYTHRVAISPRRLLALDAEAGTVDFAYRDNREAGRAKTMRLEVGEFLRRFGLHTLPERFAKIRHYGLLANRGRQQRMARIRAVLVPPGTVAPVVAAEPEPDAGKDGGQEGDGRCPHCGGALVLVAVLPRPRRRVRPLIDSS
ncbi:MAG TPA: IS91 family transposase [Phycisphaerae bacterium]|nr:IS91 family transposase [Phycisphaerae bacterium]HNU53375.1 IS91 family transposase [Verrucomicrobiota bacterium]